VVPQRGYFNPGSKAPGGAPKKVTHQGGKIKSPPQVIPKPVKKPSRPRPIPEKGKMEGATRSPIGRRGPN